MGALGRSDVGDDRSRRQIADTSTTSLTPKLRNMCDRGNANDRDYLHVTTDYLD